MSRRDQIRTSEAELGSFLDEQRTLIVATIGRDGWPHMMSLWFTVRDGELWAWTYERSTAEPPVTWDHAKLGGTY